MVSTAAANPAAARSARLASRRCRRRSSASPARRSPADSAREVELREIVILFGCLVVAVICHEVSHGVVALWFGDDTAKRAGRLTLNPIPHVDPFGSLLLPAMGAVAGLPVLGYAKPVPVNVTK